MTTLATTSNLIFVPAAEAAFIAGLTDRQMQRVMDEKIIPTPLLQSDNGRRFAKLGSALAKFYFSFERTLTADARRDVIERVTTSLQARSDWDEMLALTAPRRAADWSIVLTDVQVNLDNTIRSVQGRIAELAAANRLVSVDPEIMGGLPVLKGTRVPIDTVLAMKKAGSSIDDIKKHYPHVTEQQIDAAEVYRIVNPRRGRPAAGGARDAWTTISKKAIARKQ